MLFSYVVEHDYGIAPNPYGGCCTLALCKFSSSDKRNIVELAQPGDWVAGTGGVGRFSAGHGRLIYAMRVEEQLTLADYFHDPRFASRADNLAEFANCEDRYALVSSHFFYFGANAVDIDEMPDRYLDHPFEKRGPSHRSKFSQEFIDDFACWLESSYRIGVHGDPCGGRPAHAPRRCNRRRPAANLRSVGRRHVPGYC